VNEQIQKDIKLMVDLLPANQREVVFMRYFKKMSFKEIASLTNVSINTSLGRMRYALFNLRRMAKQYDMELELV
jgi:RNA polymerase sigma-70 factor (ECF subfamily)